MFETPEKVFLQKYEESLDSIMESNKPASTRTEMANGGLKLISSYNEKSFIFCKLY